MGANFQSKPISWISIICSIILLLTYFTTSSLSARPKHSIPPEYRLNPSAIEPSAILEYYNLPTALLPKSAIIQHFNSFDGKFTVKLKRPCSYQVDGNYLKFESTISVIISDNSISNVEGIKLKVLSQWVSLTKVIRVQDRLTLTAGKVSRQSLIFNFQRNPSICVIM
ncbi:PREDICTED: uncharacterized protein LOC109333881 [Lupinus angustifolius]|uniref:uncharacterized protein LOC109333881 n=1 Tax=Lupinus angustifolius TaxID=3871 RepID=UPI00092F97F5|nr:PREDICTED: uncharacterized protein LOC109333881 [Lupinus angustifolius]